MCIQFYSDFNYNNFSDILRHIINEIFLNFFNGQTSVIFIFPFLRKELGVENLALNNRQDSLHTGLSHYLTEGRTAHFKVHIV